VKIQTNDFVKECGGRWGGGREERKQNEQRQGKSGWSCRWTKEARACRCSRATSCSECSECSAVWTPASRSAPAADETGARGFDGRFSRFAPADRGDAKAWAWTLLVTCYGGKMPGLHRISRSMTVCQKREIVRGAMVEVEVDVWRLRLLGVVMPPSRDWSFVCGRRQHAALVD
jgi:hypothetical protein